MRILNPLDYTNLQILVGIKIVGLVSGPSDELPPNKNLPKFLSYMRIEPLNLNQLMMAIWDPTTEFISYQYYPQPYDNTMYMLRLFEGPGFLIIIKGTLALASLPLLLLHSAW